MTERTNSPDTPPQLMDMVSRFIAELAFVTQAVPPSDGRYPQALLLLASAGEQVSSRVAYLPLITTDIEGRPDGWAQALSASRDLLALLTQMNNDYKLGLELDAAVRSHPLFAP